jgi:hypothetical protein
VDANGNQEAELQITGAENNADQIFICKVQSSAYPSSDASEVKAPINVYGTLIILALDLSI